MFDVSFPSRPSAHLGAVRSFFRAYGDDLAEAARILGGTTAEARVVNLAAGLETARRLEPRILRELKNFLTLLSWDEPGDPDDDTSWVHPCLDPASRTVETICIVTDALEDLLESLGEQVPRRLLDCIDGAGPAISG